MVTFNQQFSFFALVALLLFPRCLLAEVLVVTGANNPPVTMNRNQVCDLFTGKVAHFPDGTAATPIDQPESKALREEFYSKVLNKSVAEAKANWAKLYFTGRGVPPLEATDSDEVKRIVNTMPGAIGYIERSALDSSVRIVFDGQ